MEKKQYLNRLAEDKKIMAAKGLIYISSDTSIVTIVSNNKTIFLSKRQSQLVYCLVNGITDKNAIINKIWGEECNSTMINRYSQLVYQLRQEFLRHYLPKDILITLPRFGLCFNQRYLQHPFTPENKESNHFTDLGAFN